MSSAWYGEDGTNGTVAVTNGSPTVTGTGTSWLTNKAVPAGKGYGIILPDGKLYGILSCTADGTITLVKNYAGSTVPSGGAYSILPVDGPTVELLEKITTLLASSNYSAIAALSPIANDSIRYKSGAWTNRSIIQDLVDLFSGLSEVNVASASTCDIGGAASPKVAITGTTTITSFGTTATALRIGRFTGALTLTNGSTLVLPGGANIVTAAGDTFIAVSDASATPVWRVLVYTPATDTVIGAAEVTVASATTTDIGAVNSQQVAVSGTTTITSFGTKANRTRTVRFTGALTLTHNATSLILLGGANRTTAAGDVGIYQSDSSGNWREVAFTPALSNAIGLAEATVASATTCDIGAVNTLLVAISGTTTITGFGTGANKIRFGRFTGALILTHNATSLILPGGGNISTTAGDTFIATSDASGNWRILSYVPANSTPLGLPEGTAASASTCDIGAVNALRVNVTGTTGITSFGTAVNRLRFVRFSGILTITHNGTSLALIGATNRTTAAGDVGIYASDASGNWKELLYSAGASSFNPASPGAIGGTTPAAGTFTNLTATGLLDLSGASAGQIKFAASQNASSDANTLDDYEEGTFTPTLKGSSSNPTVTYSFQTGRYVKIGRVCDGVINVGSSALSGGSGNLESDGLPFTSTNTDQVIPMGLYAGLTATTNYNQFGGLIGSSTSKVQWAQSGSGQSSILIPVSAAAATTIIESKFTYHTAA